MVTRTSEPELYKDKIEVSLDGRQIFYLFFGGAVVACMVFVLGVMIGRRLEARAHVDRAATTSARKDPLAALDRLAAGNGELTYPAALGGAVAPLAEVDRAIQAVTEPAEPPAPPAAEKAKAPPSKLPAKPAVEADRARKPPGPDGAGPHRLTQVGVSAVPGPEAIVGPVDRPEPAIAKGAGPSLSGREPESSGKFTLQLSAFQDRGEADAFMATVKGAGYGAYVVSAEVEGKGTFYRVRLGNYDSYDRAVAAKAEFERKVPKIAYVTRL